LIILDENVLDGQRLLLEAWRLPARQIGVDIGRKGLKDDQIPVLLREHRNATFFTRDADFYQPDLRHRSYCLVVAEVGQNEVAVFVRRFLNHPDFDTQTKRMGKVVRISHAGIAFRGLRSHSEVHVVWSRLRRLRNRG
jgi:hypothetical protein